MLTVEQEDALRSAFAEARASQHIWPAMAACEAMLESSWGTSELARQAKNLFGQKQSHPPVGSSLVLPTQEFLNGAWLTISATWKQFPAVADCFTDRMNLLQRLAATYPDYARALRASTPEEFVRDVSVRWSTDPARATKCLAIFQDHQDLLT